MRDHFFETGILRNPYSSTLVKAGNTKVVTAVSVLNSVPEHVTDNRGWLTAEYSLMPGSTFLRVKRERKSISGRTAEIQRLIGRSLRMTVDFSKIPGMTFVVDCDVMDADGGTRTTSINGGMLACALAGQKLVKKGLVQVNPIKRWIGAISACVVKGEVIVDPDYKNDSVADADFNFVFCENGNIIEIQGTAEKEPVTDKVFVLLFDQSRNCVLNLIRKMKIIAGNQNDCSS